MTKNCPFDHPSVYHAATLIYLIGMTSLVLASTSRTLGPIVVFTLLGLLGVSLGWYLDRRRVEARVKKAVAEDRKLQPVLRLHMVVRTEANHHRPTSACWCDPTEVSPGLWVHHQPGQPSCLEDLESNQDQWTTLREQYIPKEK